jgi:hypothetical protein
LPCQLPDLFTTDPWRRWVAPLQGIIGGNRNAAHLTSLDPSGLAVSAHTSCGGTVFDLRSQGRDGACAGSHLARFEPRTHGFYAVGQRGLIDDFPGNEGVRQRDELILRKRQRLVHLLG